MNPTTLALAITADFINWLWPDECIRDYWRGRGKSENFITFLIERADEILEDTNTLEEDGIYE